MQTLANLTPFPHMINTVVEVFIGSLTGWAVVAVLLQQAAWFVFLWLAGQLLLRAGMRRLVVLGG